MPEVKPDFADLFRKHHARIYRYVQYRIQDEMIAEDLTADIFERAYRHLENYDPSLSGFSTWIGRIAHNRVDDYFDSQAYHDRHEVGSEGALEELPSPDASPETQVVTNETIQQLLACLERLSPRDREIVALRFALGLRHKEIADLLNSKEHTISVIVLRALQRLRMCQEKS